MKNPILVILTLLFFTSCKQDPLQKLPEFKIFLSDSSTIFNTKDIPRGTPTVIVHFNADCKECQEETEELLKNMDQFKNVQFYFVTMEKFHKVRIFKNHFKLDNYKNIKIGMDYKKAFSVHFETKSTPLTAVYNKKKKLTAVFKGKANMSDLISTIKSIE